VWLFVSAIGASMRQDLRPKKFWNMAKGFDCRPPSRAFSPS
jgi:hypothetical protein